MQHSAANYDKVLKPVTRAAASLQRDKELKRSFSGVIKLIDKLESATDEVAKFKSVVDEKSYEEKVQLLTNLNKACDNAIDELTRESKLKDKEDAKAKKDNSKKEDPKKAKDESDNPALEALASSLDEFKKQANTDLKSFSNWFSKAAKKDTMEFKVPRNVTDMIELVDAKGRIAMPGDQSFDATITLTYEGVAKIGEVLEANGKEFIGEIGRALAPIKQDVAKAFKAWNSEFAEIEQEFDKTAADKLFGDINDWFLKKLPKLAEAALMSATKTAIKDICAQSKEHKSAADKVIPTVKYDDKNIAEFVFKIPDNPADEATKAMVKDADSLIAAQKKYDDAVGEIKENYETLQKSSEKLLQGLQAAEKKPGSKFEPAEQLKEMADATPDLETAIKTAGAQTEAMGKFLEGLKKTVDDPKLALKDNATIKSSDLGKLRTDLKATIDQIGKAITSQLKELSSVVTASNEIQKAINTLTDGGKSPPKPEDLKRASKGVEDSRKAFKLKPADVESKLKLVTDGEKLKKLTESLKA